MSITPKTAGQDRGEPRTAAPGVPTQRGERPPGPADPLVGPPVTGSSPDGRTTDDRATDDRSMDGDRARRTHDVTAEPHSDLSHASTGELVKRLSTQLSELVRGELELARTELTEKGKRAGAGAGLAGAGGVVALFGVGALIAAAIAALALVVPVWLSALIIGVVLLLVAGLLALAGRKQLRGATPPVPEQAVENVQRDVQTVKGAVQHR
jgi:uncharacterized membrane protein YqjE